jgi:RNA polymerase sigma factor (sigma-70 family)
MGGSSLRRAAISDEEVANMVRRAASGDRAAWEMIVDRYVALLWAVALRHGIGEADAADVVQTTWVRLLEHIDDIRDPARISAWLATTAQREALRVVALRRRVTPSDDIEAFDGHDRLATPVDEGLLNRELSAEAQAALQTLPPAWRELLELLVSDPPPPYEEISGRLGMPVGSIGPTRGRSLVRVRAALAAS